MVKKNFFKHEIFNIGNTKPIKIIKLISLLEKAIGLKAKINLLRAPDTEVNKTSADISKLERVSVLKRKTSIKKGISKFVYWYKNYNRIKN